MYTNSIWPGAYNFINELKFFAEMFKKQLDIILKKIEETEAKLG